MGNMQPCRLSPNRSDDVTARLEYAKEHINLTDEDCKRIVCTDESESNHFQWDCKQYC